MVDRNETVLKGKNGLWDRIELGEVEVSSGDTITLDGFDSARNLLEARVFEKVTGADVTCTHATVQKITITGAGTDLACYYVAYGYKAT